MQRFCQTLELINDPFLIEEFEHQSVWPEIEDGMREIGILDLQIFRHENETSFTSRVFPIPPR